MNLARFPKVLALVIICLCSANAFANKWYVNGTTGDDTYDGTSPTFVAGNIGPFMNIQWAIDMALPKDTIYISDGYYYGRILVNKDVTIFGNNAGVAGNGSRGLETILLPDATNTSRVPNNANTMIFITTPNVYIDGLRVDGDNTGLNSSNDVRGRDIDISYGVSNAGLFDNVQVKNCVFENLHVSGITFRGNINSANINCQIGNNMFSNFADNSVAIQVEGFYADIINNDIELSTIGIWIIDFKTASGRAWQVGNNMVVANTIGLMIENCYGNTSPLNVQNNTFTTPTGIISDFGVYLNNNRDNFRLKFINNNISNSGEAYSLTNNNLLPIFFDRDTIVDCDFGIRMNNFVDNGKTDSIHVDNCQYGNCAAAGIDLFNDINRLELILKGTVFKNSEAGVILKGNCHLEPNNSTFENINGYYIQLDEAISGNLSTTDIDATSCIFNGLTGTGATDSMNFLTEDKIRHYLDDNKFAFVTFKPEYIYITTHDGNFWIGPAFAKASDNWHVFIDTVICPEDVVVTKTLNFHTRGDVSIGSFVMAGIGKTLYLHGPVMMSNTLTLKDGIVNSSNGMPTVGQPLFAPPFNPVSGGSLTSYVDGPLRIVVETKSSDSIYYPIGATGDFRPITIRTQASVLGVIGVLEAELKNGPAPPAIIGKGMTHTSLVHHWRTNNIDGLAFDNISFTGTYGTFLRDDEASNASELLLAVSDNGTWKNIGGTGSANNIGFITSTATNAVMSYVSLANAGKGSNALGKAGPIAAFDVFQSCFPDSVEFTDISSTSAGNIIGWHWDFGDGSTLNDTSIVQNPKYQYAAPGDYDVTLTVTNTSAETDVITRTITIQAPPLAGYDAQIPCFPGQVAFIDTSLTDPKDPVSTWTWSINGNPYTGNVVIHNFPSAGSYPVSLIVVTSKGCVDSIAGAVFQGDTVKTSITPAGPVSLCANDSVTLTAGAGARAYLWNTGDTTRSITVSTGSTYSVQGFNSNQCFGTDTVTVTVLPAPTANAGPDQTIEFAESTTLSGSGGGSYDWTPASSLSDKTIANPVAKPAKTTTYILRVYNSFGCEDFDTVVITVNPFDNVDIPNLITPNSDGHNDVWDLSILPGMDSAKVRVISRWGKEVFVSINYKNNWGGTYQDNGKPLPDGTYMYIIENEKIFGTLKGSIQILR